MPRFFFHLVGPDEDLPDHDGVVFASVEDAFLDLHRAVLDISFEMLRRRRDPHRHRFDVRDMAGRPLFELHFAEVLHPQQVPPLIGHRGLLDTIDNSLQRGTELRRDIVAGMSEAASRLREIQALLRRPSPIETSDALEES